MATRQKRYWLVKSEAESYSIDDLERDGSTGWTGVRNYQARNFMRDDMCVGDEVLYYHSGGTEPGIVGLAQVSRAAYPDPTQFEEGSEYFDAKSDRDEPRWVMVDIAFTRKAKRLLTLKELKAIVELKGMPLLQRGQRLSVQPVSAEHFRLIKKLLSRKT